MSIRKICVSTAILLIYCLSVHSGPQKTKSLSYEPAVVELEGKIIVEVKYGPPNYGENPQTDEKVNVPILTLSKPVSVQGDPHSLLNAETFEGVTRIQLVFETKGIAYKQFIHERVIVKGTLFRAHTGHHYTDVLLTVQEIRKQPNSPR